jgi:hypothetical protein
MSAAKGGEKSIVKWLRRRVKSRHRIATKLPWQQSESNSPSYVVPSGCVKTPLRSKAFNTAQYAFKKVVRNFKFKRWRIKVTPWQGAGGGGGSSTRLPCI